MITFEYDRSDSFHLCWIHNQKENCHYDHIPLNSKVLTNLFLGV